MPPSQVLPYLYGVHVSIDTLTTTRSLMQKGIVIYTGRPFYLFYVCTPDMADDIEAYSRSAYRIVPGTRLALCRSGHSGYSEGCSSFCIADLRKEYPSTPNLEVPCHFWINQTDPNDFRTQYIDSSQEPTCGRPGKLCTGLFCECTSEIQQGPGPHDRMRRMQ